VRPSCQHCVSHSIECVWPSTPVGPTSNVSPKTPYGNAALLPEFTGGLPSVQLPEPAVLRRCLDIFFDYHASNTFCSFLYRPDLEDYASKDTFLFTAIVCLCSRYMTPNHASEDFSLASGSEVHGFYAPIARSLARATSDDPSGT
jgi:hypothetical protein